MKKTIWLLLCVAMLSLPLSGASESVGRQTMNVSGGSASSAEANMLTVQTAVPPRPAVTSIVTKTGAASAATPGTSAAETIPNIPLMASRLKLCGTFKITHYTPAADENGGYTTTANGMSLKENVGKVCAANKADFPLGAIIYIPGYGELMVADRGVKKGVIDVLVSDKRTAFQLGVVRSQVWRVQ